LHILNDPRSDARSITAGGAAHSEQLVFSGGCELKDAHQ
jgi:hypothetical protein